VNGDSILQFDASIVYPTLKYPKQLLNNNSFTYTDGSGTVVRVSKSSYFTGYDTQYMAFDGVLYTNPTGTNFGWASATSTYDATTGNALSTTNFFNNDSTYYGEWVMLDLGETILLEYYRLYPLNAQLPRTPNTFRMYATNDNSSWNNPKSGNWTQIDNRTGITFTANNYIAS
jgi:hypothetical protein